MQSGRKKGEERRVFSFTDDEGSNAGMKDRMKTGNDNETRETEKGMKR